MQMDPNKLKRWTGRSDDARSGDELCTIGSKF